MASPILVNGYSGIPDEVHRLVFNSHQFTKPITISLPRDESSGLSLIKSKYPNGIISGIPHVGVGIEAKFTDKTVLSFLVRNGYVVIERLEMRSRFGTERYEFVIHTQKLKDLNLSSQSLDVAQRKLNSIDYTNEYTTDVAYRGETKLYALTFSYTFVPKIKGLPEIDQVFKGKAKSYLDPDDGEWKLAEIQLGDEGDREYLKRMEDLGSHFK